MGKSLQLGVLFERCQKCGYDLRGRPTDQSPVVCPECGETQSFGEAEREQLRAVSRVGIRSLGIGACPVTVLLLLFFLSPLSAIHGTAFVLAVICASAAGAWFSCLYRANQFPRNQRGLKNLPWFLSSTCLNIGIGSIEFGFGVLILVLSEGILFLFKGGL